MLSVIIPAFNEEEGIGATLETLQATLRSAAIVAEIIVVDDGSTDRTADVAAERGATVISHPANVGYGRSLKDGILRAKYDLIAITDADGTYPVAELPRLLKGGEGFDMVVGARTGPEYRGSFFKAPARKLLQWLVEFSVGRHIPDVNSGMRIIRKSVILKFLDTLCDGFSFTTTLTMALLLNAHFVAFVPIPYFSRKGRSKIRLTRDTLRMTQVITEAILYYNPIKIFLVPTCLLALVGLVILICAPFVHHSIFLAGVGVACLLTSSLTFAMGLLADLLRRIMHR
jgi:glycosyltransferase involved in cell wall biosynthesis